MPKAQTLEKLPKQLSSELLNWYDKHGRDLPWRKRPESGQQTLADPYSVWLSEIMLQQTTVAAVKPYFENFLRLWPTVADLAATEDEAIMVAWAGLGYYSRARNLLKCARMVMDDYNGKFPETAVELQKFPGIGPYTAAAVASIAFRDPVPVVDGNVERVVTRLLSIDTPLPVAKDIVRKALLPIIPSDRPGDLAQAFMDLGATLCSPKRPACSLCPLNDNCSALTGGNQEKFPVKLPKKQKPTRIGAAFVLVQGNRSIWLQKRAPTGLLADMTEVPTTDWTSNNDGVSDTSAAPLVANWNEVGMVRHTFTHFHLELIVFKSIFDENCTLTPAMLEAKGRWANINQLEEEALPNLMRKVIAKALS
ncbi:MAG: A/G-specific adenine glycosylase [Hyphomicrobiales bacterium]